ncbi:DUF4439 domain-containing protein, partial [Nocardia sp. NPDC003648]
MTDQRQALQAALDSEYAAVYSYGVIAAYANADRARMVAEFSAAHRARRDRAFRAVQDHVQDNWVSFARTGEPLAAWSPYTA